MPVFDSIFGSRAIFPLIGRLAVELPASRKLPVAIPEDFARSLAGEMKQAAGIDLSIRLVDWHHIKNMLRAWGLWPISAIK